MCYDFTLGGPCQVIVVACLQLVEAFACDLVLPSDTSGAFAWQGDSGKDVFLLNYHIHALKKWVLLVLELVTHAFKATSCPSLVFLLYEVTCSFTEPTLSRVFGYYLLPFSIDLPPLFPGALPAPSCLASLALDT
jgi:hypothetical protein